MAVAKDTWVIYTDNSGEWRWRCTASNGRIVGAATQGYKNRADCVENAKRFGYTGS
ncbi:MAG: YegP family protein [Desulfovibrionaceae bacterium]